MNCRNVEWIYSVGFGVEVLSKFRYGCDVDVPDSNRQKFDPVRALLVGYIDQMVSLVAVIYQRITKPNVIITVAICYVYAM